MKIFFVYPNVKTKNGPHYQHGVGSLISALKQANHEVRLAYLQEESDLKSLSELVKKYQPNLAALSFGTNQWQIARLAAAAIKEVENIPVICGGIHATFQPTEVLSNPNVDAVCIGEGEGALVELANVVEKGLTLENKELKPLAPDSFANIKNLWIKTADGIVKNPLRPLIDDLDSLPFGDRNEFPMRAILEESGYEMSVMASRGCPLFCTYCCNHAWSKLYSGLGKYVRFRSVENMLSEIAWLQEKYRIETLYFEDDIFTLDKKWTSEFVSEYPKFFKYPFRIYVRVEAIDFDMLSALKDAGLYMINIGLESGDERIRRDVMKRNMTNRQIERVFDWAKKLGLITRDFNIVGVPGETWRTVKKTVALNRKILPDQIQVSIFYPYPGTELHELCEKNGWIVGDEKLTYFEESGIVNLPTMSREEIAKAYKWFCDEARKIEAAKEQYDFKRSKSGYYNFIEHLDEAKIILGSKEQIRRDRAIIKGERKFVIFEHPRAKLLYEDVKIRPNSFIDFGIALDPRCLSWGGRGVQFVITLLDGRENVIFDQYIDPKSDLSQNKWHNFSISLENWADRKVGIILETQPDPSGDLIGAWSLWAMPLLDIKK